MSAEARQVPATVRPVVHRPTVEGSAAQAALPSEEPAELLEDAAGDPVEGPVEEPAGELVPVETVERLSVR